MYLLYGPRFFPPDAAHSADNPRASRQLANALAGPSVHEDKGPFGSGRPSFALFSKYNSNIL